MKRRSFITGLTILSTTNLCAFTQENKMALTKFGFIVTGTDLDPTINKMSMKTDSFEMIVIGVSEAQQGVGAAIKLVDQGIQLLELCGGFGPVWTGKIIEAIDGSIPVGSVGYGPESIDQMHALFS